MPLAPASDRRNRVVRQRFTHRHAAGDPQETDPVPAWRTPTHQGPSPKALAKVVSSGGPGEKKELTGSPQPHGPSPLTPGQKLPPPPGSPWATLLFLLLPRPGRCSQASPHPPLPKNKPEQMRWRSSGRCCRRPFMGNHTHPRGPWVAPRKT